MSDSLDPRTASTTVVTGPGHMRPGDVLVKVEPVTVDGLEVLMPAAIPGVPEYVGAAHSEAEANALRPELTQDLDWRGELPSQPNATPVFNFYAAAGSAVTAAMAGVESFTNHQISRFAGAAGAVEYEGRSKTREDLWNYNIDERLGEVLPALSGKPSPKQESWWQDFRRLQGLAALARHGISAPYKKKGLSGEKPLVQRYIDREYAGAASMMLQAFSYFEPSWVDEARLDQLPTAPNKPR